MTLNNQIGVHNFNKSEFFHKHSGSISQNTT